MVEHLPNKCDPDLKPQYCPFPNIIIIRLEFKCSDETVAFRFLFPWAKTPVGDFTADGVDENVHDSIVLLVNSLLLTSFIQWLTVRGGFVVWEVRGTLTYFTSFMPLTIFFYSLFWWGANWDLPKVIQLSVAQPEFSVLDLLKLLLNLDIYLQVLSENWFAERAQALSPLSRAHTAVWTGLPTWAVADFSCCPVDVCAK